MEAWRRATVLRACGRNAFAVAIHAAEGGADPPCVCEIHCGEIDAGDRRDFNAAVRAMPRAVEQLDGAGGVPVEVRLGVYSMALRCWIHCALRHPPAG